MSFNDRYRLKCNKDEFVQNTVAGHEPMSLLPFQLDQSTWQTQAFRLLGPPVYT